MSSSSIVVPTPGIQAKLGWVFSLYAGVFAFLFSLFIFSPGSGTGFALLAGASALVTARLANRQVGDRVLYLRHSARGSCQNNDCTGRPQRLQIVRAGIAGHLAEQRRVG